MTEKEVVSAAKRRKVSLGRNPNRRLDYLAQLGLIHRTVHGLGRGKGVASCYLEDTVDQLLIIKRLQFEGVPMTMMKRVIELEKNQKKCRRSQ